MSRRRALSALLFFAILAIFGCIAWLLRSETPEDFIKNLPNNDSFVAYHTAQKAAQVNLEEMLGNRRCVNLLSAIEKLEQQERDRQCSVLFTGVLQKHAEAMRTVLRHALDETAPANKQSLRASQLALGFALFATSQCGTTATLRDQFSALDEFEAEIEWNLAENAKKYSRLTAIWARHYLLPDNRASLNVLCLHASRLGDQQPVRSINKATVDFPKHRLREAPSDSLRMTKYWAFDWPDKQFVDLKFQRSLIKSIQNQIFRDE